MIGLLRIHLAVSLLTVAHIIVGVIFLDKENLLKYTL